MSRKPNKTGRDPNEHFLRLDRRLLETPAWRALSLAGKAVYPFVRLEWHGPKYNNNGKIRLSVRQAAEKAGIGINTAAKAFHDLQAKGFLHVKEMGALGVAGEARAPSFEITELQMAGSNDHGGRRLFEQWRKGSDFAVPKHHANNPNGRNGNKTPSSKRRQSSHQIGDVSKIPVIKSETGCHQNRDVRGDLVASNVTNLKTSLITIPMADCSGNDTPQSRASTLPRAAIWPRPKAPTLQMIS